MQVNQPIKKETHMVINTDIADRIAAASKRIGKNTTVAEKLARVREELAEVEAELAVGNQTAAEKEMGDLLLSIILLCRGFEWQMGFDRYATASGAYEKSARKVQFRLEHIEAVMAAGETREAAIKAAKALYP